MSAQTVFDRLREPIDPKHIKQRTQGKTTLDYVEWHKVADILDERAPGWSSEIREVGHIGGKVFVKVALTIENVTRENIGFEDEEKSGYGDPFSNSFSMAFRRAAALFGVARHLYQKDDKHSQPQSSGYSSQQNQPAQVRQFPQNPMAQTVGELASQPQKNAINAIAKANKVDAEALCQKQMNCKIDQLSKKAASKFIDYLKALDPHQQQTEKEPMVTGQQIAAIKNLCYAKKKDVGEYGDLTYMTEAEAGTLIDHLNDL